MANIWFARSKKSNIDLWILANSDWKWRWPAKKNNCYEPKVRHWKWNAHNCFSYSFYYVDLNSSNLYLKIRLENEDTPKLIWFGAIIGFYWVSCILCSLYCAAVCRRSERCHMGVVSLWSQICVFSTISQNIKQNAKIRVFRVSFSGS